MSGLKHHTGSCQPSVPEEPHTVQRHSCVNFCALTGVRIRVVNTAGIDRAHIFLTGMVSAAASARADNATRIWLFLIQNLHFKRHGHFFLRHQSETGERVSFDFIIRIFIYKNNTAQKFYAVFHKMIHSLAAGGLIQPPSRSRGRGGRRPSRRCCAEPRTPRRDGRGRGCQ